MSDSEDRKTVAGRVKWFDAAKGFGFVIADEGGPDILLHANVLRNFGQSSVADGSGIEVVVQETDRGVQALEVVSLQPPATTVATQLEDIDQADFSPDDQELVPARVKWFDKVKGFGFANIFGDGEDIFIHIEVLRRSGFADLQPGEAIGMKVVDGKRGRMASAITAWDAALIQ